MRDLFLRFPDEATAKTHLYHIELAYDGYDQQLVTEHLTPRYKNLDVIGVIDSDQFVWSEPEEIDGYVSEPQRVYIPLPGWHVNIRALPDEDIASLLQFEVFPTNPRRVWA